MKLKCCIHFGLLLLACGIIKSSAVDHFVALDGGHVSPFTSWADAATNIQAAIDAASADDTVWVTNGVYSAGGKVMEGDLTNRIALDKAITVRSVNGPQVTAIEGIWPPLNTNGPVGVRCAWLTNDAQLRGFTLRGGSTRGNTTNSSLAHGGGVWGSSLTATVADCFIVTNRCHLSGGGAYQVTATNCLIGGNRAIGSGFGTGSGGGVANCRVENCQLVTNRAEAADGGGAMNATLLNCLVFGNSSFRSGGAAMSCTLLNCTITGNTSGGAFIFGSAVQNSSATNCIIWGNAILFPAIDPSPNYVNSTLSHCCTTPLPTGYQNTAADPQLLADGIHIADSSPCLAAGLGDVATGTDIDGQSWAASPSIGADQWIAAPLLVKVATRVTGLGKLQLVSSATGQSPLDHYWYKDGVLLQNNGHYTGADSTNLLISGFGVADAGNYQLVISNSLGTASLVVPLVVRCVDANGLSPASPYTNCTTAATNIQDAVDAANVGDVILVTNGFYASGGKVIPGDMMNRVAVDKAVTVMSANGPAMTTISGAASETSPAVRPAWLADDAVICGFKIRDGDSIGNGGGVWCASARSSVLDCYIVGNSARYGGGGCFSGTLYNCIIRSNRITYPYTSLTRGGGTCNSVLNNCAIDFNFAPHGAIGCEGGVLNNCTVTRNTVQDPSMSAAVIKAVVNNSIVWDNGDPAGNHGNSAFQNSCTFPLPAGPGNISSDPQLVDPLHISVTSPCRAMASALYASGVDIDGEFWTNLPSIGCDEVIESGLTGLLQLALSATRTNLPINRSAYLSGDLAGRATRLEWSFGDGTPVTDRGYATSYSWTNAGDYLVTLTAYNADNPNGVSASVTVQVTPIDAPVLTLTEASPSGFQFQFEGQPEIIYSVYYTTDLTPPITWTVLGTVTGDGNPIQVTDPAPPLENCFYRVVAE